MSDAMNRLEASRSRLRLAMVPPIESEPSLVAHTPTHPVFQRVLELPAVGSVIDSVGAWWSHHPLRPVAQVANEASTAVVRPLAQRSPYTLVLVAAAVGASLAWSRPWRWMFRSALFAGLVPQLASRIVSRMPVESWISMASAALNRRSPRPVGKPTRSSLV